MSGLEQLKELVKDYTVVRNSTFPEVDFSSDPSIDISTKIRIGGFDEWTIVLNDPILDTVFVLDEYDEAMRVMYEYLNDYVTQFKEDYKKIYFVTELCIVETLDQSFLYDLIGKEYMYIRFLDREKAEFYAENLGKD